MFAIALAVDHKDAGVGEQDGRIAAVGD